MVIYKFLSTMNVEVQYNRIRFQFKFLYVYLFFFTFFWGAPQWSFWQLCCVFETLLSSNILTCSSFACSRKTNMPWSGDKFRTTRILFYQSVQ